jgi:hypothetical protein
VDGVLQGAMQYYRHPWMLDRTPHLYVGLVATAPWNLSEVRKASLLVKVRLWWHQRRLGVIGPFTGVGAVLMCTAVKSSESLNYQGRIALHSLETSETFYQKLGLTSRGPDCSDSARGKGCEGLKLFTLSADGRRNLLNKYEQLISSPTRFSGRAASTRSPK